MAPRNALGLHVFAALSRVGRGGGGGVLEGLGQDDAPKATVSI